MTDNTTIRIVEMRPCAAGCVRKVEGDPDRPVAARHGAFCDRCYHRTERALDMIPSLVAHILRNVLKVRTSTEGTDESQRTKKHPPLPFNVAAFDDANELYARLVYWTQYWSAEMKRQAPGPSSRAWRTDGDKVAGLPANVDPEVARYDTGIMANWLTVHLDDILEQPATEDVAYFLTEIRDTFRTAARWPSEDKPRYVPEITCWRDTINGECKARIAWYPPPFSGGDTTIVCDAGHHFPIDEYDRMLGVFQQVKREKAKEQLRAVKVAERLTRKYKQSA